jgi:ubiquitin carboxyl-terminal hydrolase 8
MFSNNTFGVIRVSTRDRDFLIKNLDELENIPATNRATRVALVEKHWHDGLITWLKMPYMPAPGAIATSALFHGGKPDSSVVRGVDFEIVHFSIWDKLVRIFGPARCILGQYVLNPSTNKPIVLLSPPQQLIDVDGDLKHKSVAGDWLVGDVKRQFCEALDLVPSDYSFWVNSSKVADSQTMSQAMAAHPSTWVLKKSALPSSLPPVHGAATVRNSPRSRPLSAVFSNVNEAPVLRHVGLRNLGNTCFFNSAIQCLLRVPALFQLAISPDFKNHINTANPKGSGGRIASAFSELAEQMSGKATSAVSPRRLHSEVCRKFPIFANWGQHDAQELLSAVLDALHEDLNQGAGRRVSASPSGGDPWDCHVARNSSPVLDIFHGALGSSIECPKCRFKKVIRDPFSVLSVPIPRQPSRTISLESCLDAFANSEVLDANNKWRCDRCGQLVQATKESRIYKCAQVMIIHVKRFEGTGWSSKKVTTPISYPDVLDTSIFTGHANGARYKLIGAVFHGGSLTGGHYTSAALDQRENAWYYYNDSSSSAINVAEAHSDKVYILFYQKC